MSPLFTVGTGAPDVAPGTYSMTLLSIEPKTIVPKAGPDAGSEVDVFEWTFTIDEGDFEGIEIPVLSSTNAGPKSKMFSFLTALLGGNAPVSGTSFEAAQLVGRRVLGQVTVDESGWPRIAALLALPAVTRRQAVVPQPAARPVTEAEAFASDDQPF